MDTLLLTATCSSTAATLLFVIYHNKGSLVSRMTRLAFGVIFSLIGSVCGLIFLYGKFVG